LRLRERQLGRKPDDLISFDSAMPESILDDWIVETEKQALQEDEVPLCTFLLQEFLLAHYTRLCLEDLELQ
jgi:hypothetical protein